MWDFCWYHVVYFHCTVSCLAMFHGCVFSLRIFELLKRCIVSLSLKCPRVYLIRVKYFYVKNAWLWGFCRYRVVFFFCIVSDLAKFHVISLGILEVLNRCIVSHSLLWFRGHLSRGKDFYIKRTWMLDWCRYNVVFFQCSVSRLAMFHSRVFSLGILEILKRTLVSSFLKCSRGCLTRVKYY